MTSASMIDSGNGGTSPDRPAEVALMIRSNCSPPSSVKLQADILPQIGKLFDQILGFLYRAIRNTQVWTARLRAVSVRYRESRRRHPESTGVDRPV